MIHKIISLIETKIKQAVSMKEEKKEELLKLLSDLKEEIQDLPDSHDEQVQSIAAFAGISAHEATREKKDPGLIKISIDGLASSVKSFEASHPKLVEVVNSICVSLSGAGI